MGAKKFLKVVCPRCNNNSLIYSRATSRVKCSSCNKLLVKPTGGKICIKALISKIYHA